MRLAVGESPFASTKEMLEQMHWGDIAILKRLTETTKPKDSVFRTWQLLTTMCVGVAEQIESLTSINEKQDRLSDLLPLLESIFTRLSESSSAQGKHMRPEHMMSVKKALGIAVRGITEGGRDTHFLSNERRKSIAVFCDRIALARSKDKVLEISLQRYVVISVGCFAEMEVFWH